MPSPLDIEQAVTDFCKQYLSKNKAPETAVILGGLLLSHGIRALLGAGMSYNQVVGIARREVDRRIKLREQRPAA